MIGNFDFTKHLWRQRTFSARTFGPGPRTEGVCDHIMKELNEILDNPTDLEEWIDVVILALDGAWRTGATPEQIIEALVVKQTKNEGRKWPDWRTADAGKAIEHVRHGPIRRDERSAEQKIRDENQAANVKDLLVRHRKDGTGFGDDVISECSVSAREERTCMNCGTRCDHQTAYGCKWPSAPSWTPMAKAVEYSRGSWPGSA